MKIQPERPTGGNVLSLAHGRGRRRRTALARKARTWVLPLLLVASVPAAVLIWDAAGRPSPLHALPAFRPPPPPLTIEGDVIDGRRIVLIDGDTIGYGAERFRIANIDAPQAEKPRCEAERVAGLKVKARLAQLVRVETVTIKRDGRERSGSILATLSVDGRDIGDQLVAERLVLPWREEPGARTARIRHWCG